MMILTKGLIYTAKIRPSHTAILENGHAFTYSQLAERTARLKKVLKEMGVRKGDRVGLLMLNNFRYIEIFFACTAIGAIYVPLNYRFSIDELEYVMNDSGIKVLFLHREFLPLVQSLGVNTPSIEKYILAEDMEIESELVSYENMIAKENGTSFELDYDDVTEEDLAGIFYTGGTTGRSKGVMFTHRNIFSNYFQTINHVGFTHETNFLHSAPMFHLATGASAINLVMVGGTQTIIRSFTPKIFFETVETFKVTMAMLVPTMLNMVLNDLGFHQHDISSLNRIGYGASPMSLALLQKAMRMLPDVQFAQGFGMTEACGVAYLSYEDHKLFANEKDERKLRSCGRAILGVELKVVDENGNSMKTGQIGEIVIKGRNIMKGYWKLPEETAKVIKDGWYHTGDMATIDDDHYIYIVDRKKDMIISGGENVYSQEVEDVIYKLPDVLETALIGIPDEKWGEAVTAIVVKKANSTLTEKEIIEFIRPRLANYKVPKFVKFVDELPKTASGKILKRTLREQYWQGSSRMVN
ncbi:long-chain-fatty-acid--CoA ligase [Neobacillus sp. NRS-1170]|uniref:long-chain-fatty-acid--CoA ligase n=1 Tax=Neobacillus sp. NRS-1170 TaxID=3233898 RepID=UPI003D2BB247